MVGHLLYEMKTSQTKNKKEVWKEFQIKRKTKPRRTYAFSNLGRVYSYSEKTGEGKILRGSVVRGYMTLDLIVDGQRRILYVHREIAKLFIPRPPRALFVIHLDYDKRNNAASNLRWATKREMHAHLENSPALTAFREGRRPKLHPRQVRRIKRLLADPNGRKVPAIAEEFGVSKYLLYRVQKGKCWQDTAAD